ncbi:MAG: hypothetical protein R3F54_25805, partial [Alphaproteobacteria bacterium]
PCLDDRVPDARTIWLFREKLAKAGAIETLFSRFDAAVRAAGFISHVHRNKPHGRPMPETTRRTNGRRSKLRVHVEHVFAEQKERMGPFIRTIGLARATTKIGLANLVDKLKRLIWLQGMEIARASGKGDKCGVTASKQDVQLILMTLASLLHAP